MCKFIWFDANLYFFFVPYFASWSACSFLSMFVCAFTLYIVVGCVQLFSISTITISIVLSAWLLWWMGCFICVLSTYIQLRQTINTCWFVSAFGSN